MVLAARAPTLAVHESSHARHPSVDTYLFMLIHSITPPLISTPIITAPRPPCLHLEDPGGAIRTFPVTPGLSAVTQDETELEFLSVDEVMKADPQSLSWKFFF